MIELFIVFLLSLLNGFFSMSEMALISVKKNQLTDKANSGNKNAGLALQLLKNPENFLSAVQVGITLIGIVSGLFGGVALADNLKPYIEQIPVLQPYASTIAFAVIVMFITYLSIVVGELFPKTIALNYSLQISLLSAPVIYIFTKIANPLVWLLTFSTKGLLFVFRIKNQNNNNISEDELKSMLRMATEQGMLEKKVNEYINNIFFFDDRRLSSIMTLRRNIIWLDIQDDVAALTEAIKSNHFSQYPVCNGELNKIVGIVKSRDFFNAISKPDFKIENILQKPQFFTENQLAIDVLEKFRKSRTYFGVIVNEFGEVEGIVSLHDIIEEILGQLPGMNDANTNIPRREDNSYLINGQTRIEEIPDYIKLKPIKNANYQTLAGYILAFSNSFPAEGDKFVIGDYTFEIVDMDGTVIDKIIIKQNTL